MVTTVLTWLMTSADSASSDTAMAVKAATEASQLVIFHDPILSRENALIASAVRENRMIAITSEIRMNRAWTSRNRIIEKAMMPRNQVCSR